MSFHPVDSSRNPEGVVIHDERMAANHRSQLGVSLENRARSGRPTTVSVDGREIPLDRTTLRSLANAGSTAERVRILTNMPVTPHLTRSQALRALGGLSSTPVIYGNVEAAPLARRPVSTNPQPAPRQQPVARTATPVIDAPVCRPVLVCQCPAPQGQIAVVGSSGAVSTVSVPASAASPRDPSIPVTEIPLAP